MKHGTSQLIEGAKESMETLNSNKDSLEFRISTLSNLMLIKILENQIILNDKLDAIQESLTIIERNVI